MASKSEIPITRQRVSPAKVNVIRQAVRSADSMASDNELVRLARPDDTEILYNFFNDPSVYAAIYTLPHPLTLDSVRAFIVQHLAEKEQGVGLLFLNFDADGTLGGYTDVCIWPQWAAGELGGAVHPERQGKGAGVEGARRGFDWMFETLKLDLICETASLQNERTAKLLDRLGFCRKGEVTSYRDDGTTRQSLVWETNKKDWRRRHSAY